MIYLRLFWEFFKTGLFAIGGGMATLPFLHDIGEATGWFTQAQLMNMLAVSESTPGPIGINMATYVGFTVAGVPGAVIATLGEVTPSIIVILIIAALLRNFRENRYVDRAFYGLRPASTGLIGAACVSVVLEVLTNIVVASPETGLFNQFQLGDGGLAGLISWPGLILAAVLLALTNWVKPTKNLHPIVFIAASAVVGQDLYALLRARNIPYEETAHPAVWSMEELHALCLPGEERILKNLFLRDDKKRR